MIQVRCKNGEFWAEDDKPIEYPSLAKAIADAEEFLVDVSDSPLSGQYSEQDIEIVFEGRVLTMEEARKGLCLMKLYQQGDAMILLPENCSAHESLVPVEVGDIAIHREFGEVQIQHTEDRGWHYLRLGYAGFDTDFKNVALPNEICVARMAKKADVLPVYPAPEKQVNRCVVRLRTTMWSSGKGVFVQKSLTFLRRKSEGFNVLEEDCGATDVGHVLSRIINLNECDDGIYEVVTCNVSHDFETGHIDDYDYRLIAFLS